MSRKLGSSMPVKFRRTVRNQSHRFQARSTSAIHAAWIATSGLAQLIDPHVVKKSVQWPRRASRARKPGRLIPRMLSTNCPSHPAMSHPKSTSSIHPGCIAVSGLPQSSAVHPLANVSHAPCRTSKASSASRSATNWPYSERSRRVKCWNSVSAHRPMSASSSPAAAITVRTASGLAQLMSANCPTNSANASSSWSNPRKSRKTCPRMPAASVAPDPMIPSGSLKSVPERSGFLSTSGMPRSNALGMASRSPGRRPAAPARRSW